MCCPLFRLYYDRKNFQDGQSKWQAQISRVYHRTSNHLHHHVQTPCVPHQRGHPCGPQTHLLRLGACTVHAQGLSREFITAHPCWIRPIHRGFRPSCDDSAGCPMWPRVQIFPHSQPDPINCAQTLDPNKILSLRRRCGQKISHASGLTITGNASRALSARRHIPRLRVAGSPQLEIPGQTATAAR